MEVVKNSLVIFYLDSCVKMCRKKSQTKKKKISVKSISFKGKKKPLRF